MSTATRWSLAAGLVWAAKLGLGAMLLVAGWEKLHDAATFAQQIANYQLFPGLAPYLATTLPGVELVLGAVLIVAPVPGQWLRASALVSAGLLAAFTFAVTSVVLRGIDVECGCFSGDSGSVTWWTVARDLGLLAAAALVFWLAGARRAANAPARL